MTYAELELTTGASRRTLQRATLRLEKAGLLKRPSRSKGAAWKRAASAS
jgi:DNA-binding GntR family transcriptional regulator